MPAPTPQQNPQTPAPQNYDPQGALGGTFAPAYIPGYAPSEQAVMNWQQGRAGNMTQAQLQQTAMPPAWQPPIQSQYGPGSGQYGPNLAGTSQTYGGSYVDPDALRAMAQNLPYDLEGRRNAVAAQMAANSQAQSDFNARQSLWGWGQPVAQNPIPNFYTGGGAFQPGG